MGNLLQTTSSLDSLKQIYFSQQQQNIDIYLWRASFESSRYISHVTINLCQKDPFPYQYFSCSSSQQNLHNYLTFENYICDFRQLRDLLNLSQLLFVLKALLEGHQAIFKKFNASLISDKCSFVTAQGQIRVWINPNRHSNEFWSGDQIQFSIKSSFGSEINEQTPRFMEKEDYQLNKTPFSNSQKVLVKKIIKLISQLKKQSLETQNLWNQLEHFLSIKHQENCSFKKVLFFIHKFGHQNNLIISSNISHAIKHLISQDSFFVFEKSSIKQKKKVKNSTFAQNSQNPKKSLKKQAKLNNISLQSSQKTKKHNKTVSSSNINRNHFVQFFDQVGWKQVNRKVENNLKSFRHVDKISIKQKSSCLQSKLLQSPFGHSRMKNEFNKHQKSNKQTFNQIETRLEVKQSQKPIKNLSCSYQYSINLYMGQTKKLQKSFQSTSTEPNTGENNSLSYFRNSIKQSDRYKILQNTALNSTLKKWNTKSFEKEKQSTDSHYERQLEDHQRLSQVRKNQNKEQNQSKTDKQFFQQNFAPVNFTQQKILLNPYRQEGPTMKNIQKNRPSNLAILKKRKNSAFQCQLINQSLFNQNQPFDEITNFKESTKYQELQKDQQIQKFFYSNITRPQQLIKINVKQADNQIYKSKKGIMVGFQKDVRFNQNGVTINNRMVDVEYGTPYHTEHRTSRVISRLFSSQQNLEKSIGSISQFGQSDQGQPNSPYLGILNRLGRSAIYRKDEQKDKQTHVQGEREVKIPDIKFNFTRKKTICEYGTNRSLRI